MTTLQLAFDLFERFVIAHEQLAAALSNHETLMLPVVDRLPDPTGIAPVKELVEKADEPDKMKDRNWLKSQLDEMGVDYTTKTATTTLIKKYEAALIAQKEAAEAQEKEDNDPKNDEEVRAYLQEFVAAHKGPGREYLKGLINSFGAVNLTALDPSHYPELIKSVRQYTPAT